MRGKGLHRPDRGAVALLVAVAGAGCTKLIEPQPFCADVAGSRSAHTLDLDAGLTDAGQAGGISRPVTWYGDVRPIVTARCARCHTAEGGVNFALTTYEDVFAARIAVRNAVVTRRMPPWLAAGCCNQYLHDYSLTQEQIDLIDAWVAQGAPLGDPAQPGVPLASVGGLSRVDVTVTMPVPYTPQPAPGRVDDFRCFVLDWPRNDATFVTGMNPVPGARSVVHHLVVAVVTRETAADLRKREGRDGRPGFSCEGALGSVKVESILGGSLLGGDFPEGLGHPVGAGTALVLNIHYSLAGAVAVPDQTALQFRLDAQATRFRTLPIANPLWLVGDGMLIKAGDPDAIYRFQYDPVVVSRGRRLWLRGFAPHMHALASRQKVGVVRKDGRFDCLGEIPRWEAGWEQPYWFAQPIAFEDGDQLYVQCHFDNSAANQPIENGTRLPPRDVAWGTDYQEMCVGFVTYTEDDR